MGNCIAKTQSKEDKIWCLYFPLSRPHLSRGRKHYDDNHSAAGSTLMKWESLLLMLMWTIVLMAQP